MLRLLFILLFCSALAEAQDVIYSRNEKFDLRNGTYSVVGKVNESLYVYRGTQDGYFLDVYDEQMIKKATVVLDFIYGKIVSTRFVLYDNKIIFLYQAIESNRVGQYAVLLDESARMVKRPIMIGDTKLGLFGGTKDYFGIAVSENKTHLAIYALDDHGKELDATITWLNDSAIIAGRSRASFRADNDISEGEGLVDNEGKFYLPVYTPVGSRNYADAVYMLSIKPTERKFLSRALPLNNMFAGGTYMKTDNTNNKISIGGFYSDKKSGSYEGVLFNHYDLITDSFEVTKFIGFDEALRNASGERNKKHAFNDYQVRELIPKNDGGIVLIAEDYYVSSRSSYSPGFGYYSFYYPAMSSNIREYHYNDIMVLSYDAKGTNQWRSFVRKEQYSQEDGGMFSSYALINTGGALGFMFNDFNASHSRIQLATVAEDGQIDMHTLQSNSDDADWLPRNAKQVASREIIVPCLRKRQICFAKVVF